jgi:transcriptional regulator with XRE-family HTH domain
MYTKTIPDHHRKKFEYLSTYIRELRLNEGMTQMELSQNMNLHRNTIARAENAENLTLLSVFELADALDISLKDLFQDIE